jgi:hypothetical protein
MADEALITATDRNDARTLLNRIPALGRSCDVDLLLFFAKHWRVLLSSEQLARLLGYPLNEIARSRDVLVAAGLLTRTQDPTRPERMYVLNPEFMNSGALAALVRVASTPGGRLSLRRALMSVAAGATDASPAHAGIHEIPRDPSPRGASGPKRSRLGERRSTQPPERTQ